VIESEQMESRNDLVKRIMARYLDMCRTPFPGEDVKTLCSNRDDQVNLHTHLDLYLGEVAGYSCRPDLLHRRPRAELAKAQSFLSASFFDRYPQYEGYARRICPETTPDLHYELTLAEMNRSDLVLLISHILQSESA
jgi:hypothetical protein